MAAVGLAYETVAKSLETRWRGLHFCTVAIKQHSNGLRRAAVQRLQPALGARVLGSCTTSHDVVVHAGGVQKSTRPLLLCLLRSDQSKGNGRIRRRSELSLSFRVPTIGEGTTTHHSRTTNTAEEKAHANTRRHAGEERPPKQQQQPAAPFQKDGFVQREAKVRLLRPPAREQQRRLGLLGWGRRSQ